LKVLLLFVLFSILVYSFHQSSYGPCSVFSAPCKARPVVEINYEELDIDDFLEQRDSDPFDSEWVRIYQALEELKKGKTVADTREVEKKAYITVYEKSENDELAGYISDDFGLIADSKRLNYSDEWLDKLISCYENARIPCGEL